METRSNGDPDLRRQAPLETKYRDIADGNARLGLDGTDSLAGLETKYRDIADGNIALLVVPLVW